MSGFTLGGPSSEGKGTPELERLYFDTYYPLDEKVPRARTLPDGQLFYNNDLYTEQELKTSEAHHAVRKNALARNAIIVRLDAPEDSRIVWFIHDPVDGNDRSSPQLDVIRRLLRHIPNIEKIWQEFRSADLALEPNLSGSPVAPTVSAFAKSRKAGPMLIGGSIAMLANYAWRKAQEAEIEVTLRAGVAAVAHLMRGNLTAAEDQIKRRVADFMRGLLDDLTITSDDIIVQHDFATNRTIITVAGNALYAFKSLWAAGGTGAPEPLNVQVIVEFDASQFEFALALDVSRSMGRTPPGRSVTRLDALKDAIDAVAQAVDAVSKMDPGTVALSLVPYSNVVNVVDTFGNVPDRSRETLRAHAHRCRVQHARVSGQRGTLGRHVPLLRHGGRHGAAGVARSAGLPDGNGLGPAPAGMGGCLQPGACPRQVGFRGVGFLQRVRDGPVGRVLGPGRESRGLESRGSEQLAARKTVAGWEPGSTGIQGLPLHLSDEPPGMADPNTRFTAYSWPDARIAGTADSQLSDVMRWLWNPATALLLPSRFPKTTGTCALRIVAVVRSVQMRRSCR